MGLIARIKGEEPNIFQKVPHRLKGKGHYGEYLAEFALEHGNLGQIATFANVLVPRAGAVTSTSEIDVLMLHPTGIYVFESKFYLGWIYGSADQREWTVTYNANAKERFYNPIRQNRAHVKALAEYLGLLPEAFCSYIVFPDKCELKKYPDPTDEYRVCRRPNMLRHLRNDIKSREVVFDAQKAESVRQAIASLAEQSTEATRNEHVREAKLVAEGRVCPRCGSELVERHGKNGRFIGCNAFPKCRYTRNAQPL